MHKKEVQEIERKATHCLLLSSTCGMQQYERKTDNFYATYDGEKEKGIEEMLDKQQDIEHANVIL